MTHISWPSLLSSSSFSFRIELNWIFQSMLKLATSIQQPYWIDCWIFSLLSLLFNTNISIFFFFILTIDFVIKICVFSNQNPNCEQIYLVFYTFLTMFTRKELSCCHFWSTNKIWIEFPSIHSDDEFWIEFFDQCQKFCSLWRYF